MKLHRDLEREKLVHISYWSYALGLIEGQHKDIDFVEWKCREYLSGSISVQDETSRSRWQYILGICRQLRNGAKP